LFEIPTYVTDDAKMIKNYSKQFRSTGTFFNNSAIILKLIAHKNDLLYLKTYFFSKTNMIFLKKCGRCEY